MSEEWRPVPGYCGRYLVSDHGQVKALLPACKRGAIWHGARTVILKRTLGGRAKNYWRVHLSNPERFAYVHHLVAEAFIGPRPEGLLVLHENDETFDNRACRLRYGDREENELDRHVAKVAPQLEPAPF